MIAREAPSPKPASSSDLAKEPLPKAPAKQIRRLWEAVRAGVAMIAKRIVRERGASNFRRLGRYILDGAAEEEQAVMARMADYILGAEKSRAANVRFSNCVSTDAELALKEILATQTMNKRAKGDRTYPRSRSEPLRQSLANTLSHPTRTSSDPCTPFSTPPQCLSCSTPVLPM